MVSCSIYIKKTNGLYVVSLLGLEKPYSRHRDAASLAVRLSTLTGLAVMDMSDVDTLNEDWRR